MYVKTAHVPSLVVEAHGQVTKWKVIGAELDHMILVERRHKTVRYSLSVISNL
jgi:hypothetical protein